MGRSDTGDAGGRAREAEVAGRADRCYARETESSHGEAQCQGMLKK